MDDRLALWNCKILSVLQDVSGPMQYFTLEFPDDSSRNILEEVEFSSIHPRNYQVLSHLKSVSISKTRIITDVSCFRNVKKLKFHGCPCITDVSCLKEVYDLELSWCNGITDVSSLGKVYRLNLSESENINSVSALGNVHELNLIGAEGLEMSPP
jgi:Leucine-rich repeat (LRR) protein